MASNVHQFYALVVKRQFINSMHKTTANSRLITPEIKDLYAENQTLKHQLNTAINHAKRNEQTHRRMQIQELRLISSGSLHELIDNLLHQYRQSAGLDHVTLCLLDPYYEIQRVLEDQWQDPATIPQLIFVQDTEQLEDTLASARRPVLGRYQARRHHWLFPGRRAPVRVALLPLYIGQVLIGSINLGSYSEDRFCQSDGTEFLQRLAAIIPLCLENTLNQEKLRKVGLTDPLTGVNNRRYFDQRLSEEVLRARREGSSLTCLFLDLDKFKTINDRYGHQVGDQVLIRTANLIRQQLRVTDVLARYGGEEFSALLAGTDLDEATLIAERIRAAVAAEDYLLPGQHPLKVSLSIGIGILDAEQSDSEQAAQALLGQADAQVYRAKSRGRNCVCVPDEPVGDQSDNAGTDG